MESLMILIALFIAILVAVIANRFVAIADPDAVARRLEKAEQPLVHREPFEWIGLPLARVIPKTFKTIENDLYWASFSAPSWSSKTPAWIVGRQILMAAILGTLAAWIMRSNLGLIFGALAGWILMRLDLSAKADGVRKRIIHELPEFLQLMAAESASGAGLDTVLARASQAEGALPTWLRRVLAIAHGRSLLASRETGAGILQKEAERSGHPDLVSFAIQLGFAHQGAQVHEILTRLAIQFSDTFIGQAEIRTERLANTLGVLVAVFYFVPFLIVILFIVGVPLIKAF